MRRRMIGAAIGAGVLAVGPAGGGCGESEAGTSSARTAAGACEHQIKAEMCPFCNPAMVEQEGFCGEHGVEEALCAQCRPYLKAAFRARGDWCAEHAVPESQCVACNPDLKERITGGHGAAPAAAAAPADACEHGISEATCPFCTPALVESKGFCEEHGVAEALCVRCRPALETAFRAAGDWCGEHATPESQCTICNPELAKEGGAG